MGRNAIKINKEDLQKKLEDEDYVNKRNYGKNKLYLNAYDLRENYKKLDKDLNKINFDMENVEIEHYDFLGDKNECLVGFHTLENGLSFLGVVVGGDWEMPIFFIIYKDDKTLRGYIPEDGNIYNKIFKTAFGSEGESDKDTLSTKDKEKIRQTFPDKDEEEMNKVLNMDIEDIQEYLGEWGQDLRYDWTAIKNDIINRIEII